MNKSKLMRFLGLGIAGLGLLGIWYVCHFNGQAWSYYGPVSMVFSGIGILNAKHHRH